MQAVQIENFDAFDIETNFEPKVELSNFKSNLASWDYHKNQFL